MYIAVKIGLEWPQRDDRGVDDGAEEVFDKIEVDVAAHIAQCDEHTDAKDVEPVFFLSLKCYGFYTSDMDVMKILNKKALSPVGGLFKWRKKLFAHFRS